MKTSTILLLAGVLICLIDSANGQSTNDTNTFEPTCPPPRTCPPQPVCTCSTIAECPTETTRTRGRSPGRTRETETRMETNRTRTDTMTGRDRTATKGTRTDTRTTRRTETKTRSPGKRTRRPGKQCVPKVPRGCPTAPPVTTTTMAVTTTIEPTGFNITTIEPTTTEEPFNVTTTEATTTEATTTEATTTEVITTDINTTEPTDFNITDAITTTDTTTVTDATTTTDANATDANATEATTTEATTTEATTTEATTTEAATPPAPLTTQPPGPNITATCSSPVVDVSGQKQPPIRIFQFLVDKHNLLEYMNEAKDILEFIAWLTKLSNIHGTMKSTLLGVSSYQNGLSVTIAVSFKVYPGTNYTTSSTQIIEAVYNNFDVLREYYDVVDIKLVSLSTESSSPQAHQGRSGHKIVATKPVIVLSVIVMVGLAAAVAALSAKLIKHYGNQPSGEKCPLLEDRADRQRGFTLNG